MNMYFLCAILHCEKMCRPHAYHAVQRSDSSMHDVVPSNSVHTSKTCFGAIWELSFCVFFLQYKSSTASQRTQGTKMCA